jgi:hypothetical protein
MAVGGGLVDEGRKKFSLPESKLHDGYKKVADDKWAFVKDGMELAQEVDVKTQPPAGHAVVQLEVGMESWNNHPVPVTVDAHTIIVPRGRPVLLPIQHVNALSDAVQTRYYQPSLMQKFVARHGRRFEFRVIRWPKGYNKAELENAVERHEVIELDQ